MDGVYSALARIPLFKGVRRKPSNLEPLSSLTNATYKVTANGPAYTAAPRKDTYEYVDRAAEEHNARIMAAAGVNAKYSTSTRRTARCSPSSSKGTP